MTETFSFLMLEFLSTDLTRTGESISVVVGSATDFGSRFSSSSRFPRSESELTSMSDWCWDKTTNFESKKKFVPARKISFSAAPSFPRIFQLRPDSLISFRISLLTPRAFVPQKMFPVSGRSSMGLTFDSSIDFGLRMLYLDKIWRSLTLNLIGFLAAADDDEAVSWSETTTSFFFLTGSITKFGSFPVRTLNRLAHSDSSVTRSNPDFFVPRLHQPLLMWTSNDFWWGKVRSHFGQSNTRGATLLHRWCSISCNENL